MAFTNETYRQITDGFINENLKALRKAVSNTDNQKEMLKKIRRKEILGLRRIDNFTAIEKKYLVPFRKQQLWTNALLSETYLRAL